MGKDMDAVEAKVDDSARGWMAAADAMVLNNSDVVFLGVYSLDTYGAIATAGTDNINILPSEISAIVTHTKMAHNAFACIKLAGLNFACMSFGRTCLTGMSNFNTDEKSRVDADKIIYAIANIRYTRQASYEAKHMLNISAYFHNDVLLVGLAVSGEGISVLKILQDLVYLKEHGPPKKDTSKPTSKPLLLSKLSKMKAGVKEHIKKEANISPKASDEAAREAILSAELGAEIGSFNNPPTDNVEMSEFEAGGDVHRRRSTKADLERRRDQSKRETEFCEDWRTATIRSIEALKTIGPFSEGSNIEDDKKPLISAEFQESNDQREQGDSMSTTRRASRPTMV